MYGREESRSIVLATHWENVLENTCSRYKMQKQTCEIMVFGLGYEKSNILIKNPLFRVV